MKNSKCIFKAKDWDVLKDACPLLYRNGMVFECGFGWYGILLDLSLQIERVLQIYEALKERNSSEEAHFLDTYATQVKEKYGKLRFYMSIDTARIDDLIEEAEAKSTQICELCGCSGRMRGERWFSVRCDDCWEETSSENSG